jgi:hypothetical protein
MFQTASVSYTGDFDQPPNPAGRYATATNPGSSLCEVQEDLGYWKKSL